MIISVEDIAEQLAIRDRFIRYQRMQQTPAERLQVFMQLQAQAWKTLQGSPDGFAHFLRRNFKARAIDVSDGHGR